MTGVTDTTVTIAWNATSKARTYDVFRDGVLITTTTAITYTDQGLAAETAYSYQVRGCNTSGCSALTAPLVVTTLPAPSPPPGPFRAFSDASYWNKALGSAPADSNSNSYINALTTFGAPAYPKLVIGDWAMPIYWADPADPLYTINVTGVGGKVTVLSARLLPSYAPMPTSDGALTLFDEGAGYVLGLHKATWDASLGVWTAAGYDLYYTGSNGLCGTLVESDDPRNTGHRGIPSAIHAVRWDEIQDGLIPHALKIALDDTAPASAFPACGYENRTGTIPEGAILRIKASVDLSTKGLTPAALVIATALQDYGAVVGDTGDTPCALKLEGLETEGSTDRWSDADLTSSSLSALHWSDYEFVQLGWHRP